MAPCPLANVEATMKSVNPPNTRKGAAAFLRGWADAKEGSDTVAQIRVSLPTLPQLSNDTHPLVILGNSVNAIAT